MFLLKLFKGISARLRLSLGIMGLGFFLVILYVNINGTRVSRSVEDLSDTHVPGLMAAHLAQESFQAQVAIYSDAVMTGEMAGLERALNFEAEAVKALDGISALRSTPPEDKLLIMRTTEALLSYTRDAERVYPVWTYDEESINVDKARQLAEEAREIEAHLQNLRDSLQGNLDAELAGIDGMNRQARLFSLLLFLAMTSLSGGTAFAVVHWSLLKPVYRMVDTARRIADGDHACRMPEHADDELGQLGTAINAMTQKLQTSLEDLREQVAARRAAQEMVQYMNKTLDRRVRERTLELNASLEKLQSTQTRLVQSEKMAGIGQLAAGVAHEINNPVSFIMANLGTMGEYAGALCRISRAYEDLRGALAADPNHAAAAEELAALCEEEDLAFILEDLEGLVTESLDGADRVKEIVQNLKTFARLDETGLAPTDINAAIVSTLKIVWNELKYKAEVVEDYGDLPPVTCNIGQLNQVFMNLLVNASHAIEKQGEIRITTRHDGDTVTVAVGDTGCGIPAENLSKLFDPFFTTKDVGRGTGLGLSISHSIVEKHQGRIEVDSEPGRGTTFTVVLPVAPAPDPEAGGPATEEMIIA